MVDSDTTEVKETKQIVADAGEICIDLVALPVVSEAKPASSWSRMYHVERSSDHGAKKVAIMLSMYAHNLRFN